MALRDEHGNPIFKSCRFLLNCVSSFKAGMFGRLREHAIHQSTLPTIIETDCSKLLEAVKASTQIRSPYVHLIREIIALSSQERVCNFVKVE
jgi:hypothetical protein